MRKKLDDEAIEKFLAETEAAEKDRAEKKEQQRIADQRMRTTHGEHSDRVSMRIESQIALRKQIHANMHANRDKSAAPISPHIFPKKKV